MEIFFYVGRIDCSDRPRVGPTRLAEHYFQIIYCRQKMAQKIPTTEN